MKLSETTKVIRPKALPEGGTIGITAPSSAAVPDFLSNFKSHIESLGYNVVLGETIVRLLDDGLTSASKEIRARDFNRMVNDNNIDVIWAACGGFGTQNIIDLIDYEGLKKNPKPVIGFSDTTYLLNAIFENIGLITFLGPTAEFDSERKNEECGKSNIEFALNMLSGNFEYPLNVEHPTGRIIRSVSYSDSENFGFIVGGNITMFEMLLGTKYDIDTDHKIILLEDVNISPYELERTLTHLLNAGKFDEPAAVIIGDVTNILSDTGGEKFISPDESSHSVTEIFRKFFQDEKYPVLYGFPFSHDLINLTFPIGGLGKVSGTKRSFEILENPVIK